MKPVPRQLLWTDTEGKAHSICQDSFDRENAVTDKGFALQYPLIILGDPGIGKTELMKHLSESVGGIYFEAARFLRQPDDSIPASSLLIIDGLDEVAAMESGDPLHNVLKKLLACKCPPFIISCRTAEWRGATARLDIENDYGRVPNELILQALSEHQAVEILSRQINLEKAKKSVDFLVSNDLTGLFSNPLNLRFVAEVLNNHGELPQTRHELLENAVTAMSQDSGEVYRRSVPAEFSGETILNAVGCIMAVLLITGKRSVVKTSKTPETLCLREICPDLTDYKIAKAALGSRLFRGDVDTISESEIHFVSLHRTVAEFLGARWLAWKVENTSKPNQVSRRLLGLLSAKGGFPSSLRGLLAWLPKFSPERLGPMVIGQDAFSVVRYGDSECLSEDQSRQIIDQLKQSAIFDPHFIFDWWGMKPLKGLAHLGLLEQIRTIIRNTEESCNLRFFLLKAIEGEQIVQKLTKDLRIIAFDAKRPVYERKQACITRIRSENIELDWPEELEQISALNDEDSDRLVIELIPEIGIDKFSAKQIALAVAAHTGTTNHNHSGNMNYSYHSLSVLQSTIPGNRVEAILDQLTQIALSYRDVDEWLNSPGRDEGSRTASRFAIHLIFRLLNHRSPSVSSIEPSRLWTWLRIFWNESILIAKEERFAYEFFSKNKRLRHTIQRLALFTPGEENEFSWRLLKLTDLCRAFKLTKRDALFHLLELVARNDPAETDRFRVLVERFRSTEDQLIPKEIQEIARPFAENNLENPDWLTKKPKPYEPSDAELNYRKQIHNLDLQKQKEYEENRKDYSEHIEDVRGGDSAWITNPALTYLGISNDFKTHRSPEERIAQWLGSELVEPCLAGFEAFLNQADLPSPSQFAKDYANDTRPYIAFPLLAAAMERHRTGIGFDNLPYTTVSSIAVIAEQYHNSEDDFEELRNELNAWLRSHPSQLYRTYLKQRFESVITENAYDIPGLYRFVMDDAEHPVSTKLSLKWLKQYPEIKPSVLNTLIDGILYTEKSKQIEVLGKLAGIARKNLRYSHLCQDTVTIWQSVQFLTDFDRAVAYLPQITRTNRDLLWVLTHRFYSHHDSDNLALPVTVNQLKWIVSNFRSAWPRTERPSGLTMGMNNSWDATELIEWAIDQIAKHATCEAASALLELRHFADDGYTDKIKSAIARNKRVQIEANFSSPALDELKTILSIQPPKSATDVQSIIVCHLQELQNQLKGSHLNVVNNFYDDNGKPRTENDCRDQMLIAMGKLPYGIRTPTEVRAAQNKRSDGAFVFGDIEIPLETKGQWGKNVWTAASEQLGRYYCKSDESELKGIYVVFWFGPDAPTGKKIRRPPNNLPMPENSEQMRVALETLFPESQIRDIAMVVLDVSKPNEQGVSCGSQRK